jgi:hypothetical protein
MTGNPSLQDGIATSAVMSGCTLTLTWKRRFCDECTPIGGGTMNSEGHIRQLRPDEKPGPDEILLTQEMKELMEKLSVEERKQFYQEHNLGNRAARRRSAAIARSK